MPPAHPPLEYQSRADARKERRRRAGALLRTLTIIITVPLTVVFYGGAVMIVLHDISDPATFQVMDIVIALLLLLQGIAAGGAFFLAISRLRQADFPPGAESVPPRAIACNSDASTCANSTDCTANPAE